jgi:hypothetical protein
MFALETSMKKTTSLTGILGLSLALPAAAGFDFDLGNGDKLSFGGYIKVDARYVSGDVKYQDYWRGNNPGFGDDSHFAINVRETRFNTKYTHGDVSGFIEMYFYGAGGNEIATNSSNPVCVMLSSSTNRFWRVNTGVTLCRWQPCLRRWILLAQSPVRCLLGSRKFVTPGAASACRWKSRKPGATMV